MNEQAAITAIQAGSLSGLKVLYDIHASVLLNQAFRLLQSQAAAEDAVQDLFIKLPAMLAGFRHESSLRTWLYRCMHHQCLSIVQQNVLRSRLLIHAGLDAKGVNEGLTLGHNGMARSASAPLENTEASDHLQQALLQLPVETRSLLWLKEAEGLSLKDLAYVLGMPEGTLKARLSRARRALRAILMAKDIHGPHDL